MIDEIVKGDIVQAAASFANRSGPRRARDPPHQLAVNAKLEQPADAFFAAARARMAKEYRGYPAPLAIVDCVEAAVTLPFAKGIARERELFERLRATDESKALRHLFFAERQVTKIPDVPEDTPTREIKSAALIGAGHDGRRHRDELRQRRHPRDDARD